MLNAKTYICTIWQQSQPPNLSSHAVSLKAEKFVQFLLHHQYGLQSGEKPVSHSTLNFCTVVSARVVHWIFSYFSGFSVKLYIANTYKIIRNSVEENVRARSFVNYCYANTSCKIHQDKLWEVQRFQSGFIYRSRRRRSNVITQTKGTIKETQTERKEDEGKYNH